MSLVLPGFRTSMTSGVIAGFNINVLYLPPQENLIAYNKSVGALSDSATSIASRFLDARPGVGDYAIEQGHSLAFNGSTYGKLIDRDTGADSSVTLVGDFEISFHFMTSDLTTHNTVVGGSDAADGVFYVNSSGIPRLYIDSTSYLFTDFTLVVDTLYDISFARSSTNVICTIDGVSQVITSAKTNDFIILYIGTLAGSSLFLLGNLHSLHIEDSTGVKFSNPLAQLNETGYLESAVGPHVQLVDATLPAVELNNDFGYTWGEDGLGYSEYVSGDGVNSSAGHLIVGKIPADPNNPGYDVAGELLTNTGTPRRDKVVYGYWGDFDGTAYLAITGLVGTETVTYSSGTSTPTVSAGKIDFTSGTCGRITLSDGTDIIIQSSLTSEQAICYDISGNDNHATLTSATLPFFTESVEGSLLVDGGYQLDGDKHIPTGANSGDLTHEPGQIYPDSPILIEQLGDVGSYTADQTDFGDGAIDLYYEAAGTTNEIAPSVLEGNKNNQNFFGQKGILEYSEPLAEVDAAKALRYIIPYSAFPYVFPFILG